MISMSIAEKTELRGPKAERNEMKGVGEKAKSGLIVPVNKVYLHPGKLTTSLDPCVVTTILGSCVAVCLWDVKLKTGGINHFLLPRYKDDGAATIRFGDVAVRKLVQEMLGLGCSLKKIQAKIFGGACVLKAMQNGKQHLGEKNIESARDALKKEGIRIVGEDVGGLRARKIMFDTSDGTVWVKQI